MYCYRLGSWKVCSSLSLPWLPSHSDGDEPCDIVIESGVFADPDENPLMRKVMVDVFPTRAVVHIPGLVRFLVEDGRRIVVDLCAQVDSMEIQPFLFGVGLRLICRQRGLIFSRGCAITKDGKTVAILGPTGVGKSTLAAALVTRRGYRLATDEILIIDPVSGKLMPTYPVLKLWADSLDALEISKTALSPVRKGLEVFCLQSDGAFESQPQNLHAVCVLSVRNSVTAPNSLRLSGEKAWSKLEKNLFDPYQNQTPIQTRTNFRVFSQLSNQCAVYEWVRTKGLKNLMDLADLVEAAKEGP